MLLTNVFRSRIGNAARVKYLWTGVPATDGCQVSVKLQATGTANSVRMIVSTSETLSNPVYSGAVVPDVTYRIAKLSITGLTTNTEYFYGIEVDGVVDSMTKGRFKTFPTGAASFRVAFSSCGSEPYIFPSQGNGTDSFNNLNNLAIKPLVFLHLGDMFYGNPYETSPSALEDGWQAKYDGEMDIAARHALYRNTPTTYVYDDHDYLGDGTGGYDAVGVLHAKRDEPIKAHRRRVPVTYAAAGATDAIYHSFVIGRVRFIISDLRSNRTYYTIADSATKTMMGATQKTWWKAEITAAKTAGQVVCWATSVPWHDTSPGLNDRWDSYNTEQAELANYLVAEGMADRIFVISGDMHAIAYAGGGGGTDYATDYGASFPSYQAGPLYGSASHKGGPWDLTPFPADGVKCGQYGLIDVVDNGVRLTVTYSGINQTNTVQFTHSFHALPIYRVGVLKGCGTTDVSGNLVVSLATLPNYQTGDCLLVCAMQADATATNLAGQTITGNSAGAYTSILNGYGAGDVYNLNINAGYKIMPATKDASLTLSGYQVSKNLVYQVLAYRGVDATLPVEVTGGASTDSNSDQVNPNGITPLTTGARCVVFYAAGLDITGGYWNEPDGAHDFIQNNDESIDVTLPTLLIASSDFPWLTGSFNGLATQDNYGGIGSVSYGFALALKPSTT